MINKKILNKNVYAALREDRVNNDLSHKVLDKKTLKTVEAKLTNNERTGCIKDDRRGFKSS